MTIDIRDRIERSKPVGVALVKVITSYTEEEDKFVVLLGASRALIAWCLAAGIDRESWMDMMNESWKKREEKRGYGSRR